MIVNGTYQKYTPPESGKTAADANSKFIGLFGQSNAKGSALNATVQADLDEAITNAYIFNLSTQEIEVLQIAVNNTCNSTTPSTNNAFGIELRLMKSLADNYGVAQYLFKYTESGTQLATSGSNVVKDWSHISDGPFPELFVQAWDYYNRMYSKMPVELSMQWVVWIQGENDADASKSAAYETNLTNFISYMRTIWGNASLKFVLVSLSSGQTSLNSTYRDNINTAMENIATADVNVWYLEQNEATGDGVHYTAASLDNIATGVYNIITAN